MARFSGRRAIVTGAGDGIGAATARRLAEEGARVLAVDLDGGGLDGVARGAQRISTLMQDVSAPGAAEAIVEAARADLGGIDFLVNNAGICPTAPVAELGDDAWQRVLEVNLGAVFRICRAAIPLLKESGQGRIVNIGSVMSTLGGASMGAYPASKHGVAGLTKTLALELGEHGITANFVQPGAIVTGITRPVLDTDPAFREFWTRKSALGRLGQPEDVAAAIAFLVSEDAGFVTGHGLAVDGGAMRSA